MGKTTMNNIQKLLDELEEEIYTEHYSLNKEIYRDLESSYEGLTSDESVADTLIANTYEFSADGKMW
jgi:hypothetical protein